MKTKKIPERRCLGCGESFPKSSLIRVVRTPESTVELDTTGRRNGRGAYLCPKSKCFKIARKKKRFSQNLEVDVPEEILNKIEKQIEELERTLTDGV